MDIEAIILLLTFGLIVIFSGMPDHKTKNPEAAAIGRQVIITFLAILLMVVLEFG